jgi:hypothetical protein
MWVDQMGPPSEEGVAVIVAIFQGTEMTPDQYDRVLAALEAVGLGAPAGRLDHVSAWQDGRFCVTEVWESPQHLASFGMTFFPVLARYGVAAPPPEIYEFHKEIRAS